MTHDGDWRSFLKEHAVAYLFPTGDGERISREAAQGLIDRLRSSGAVGATPDVVCLCWAMALTGAEGTSRFVDFTQHYLPRLLRSLPTTSRTVERRWHGGFRGRLDIARTVAAQMQNGPAAFVTRDRRRDLDRPENRVLRATVTALGGAVSAIVQAGVQLTDWAAHLSGWDYQCKQLLGHSELSLVPDVTASDSDIHWTLNHRDPGFQMAARLLTELRAAAHGDTVARARLIQVLIQATVESRQFELAVALCVASGVDDWFSGHGKPNRTEALLLPNSARALVRWECANGLRVELWFDSIGWLPTGADLQFRELQHHYLGSYGTSRPDVTLAVCGIGRPLAVLLFEAKASDSLDLACTGLWEAHAYAREFARFATGARQALAVGWLKASGELRAADRAAYLQWSALRGSDEIGQFLRQFASVSQ